MGDMGDDILKSLLKGGLLIMAVIAAVVGIIYLVVNYFL